MLKHTKNLLKANSLFIAVTITISIGYLSLIKISNHGVSIYHLDKIEHFIAYFVLTFSWLFAFKKTIRKACLKYTIVFLCIFYGIIIEVLQTTITNYREASYLDVLANSLGVIIALLIFSLKIEKKQSI